MRCEAHLGCSSGVIKLAELPTSTGKVHQDSGVYDGGGYIMYAPSSRLQKSTEGADREKRLGNLNGFTGGSFAGMVYHPAWLSPSLTTMGGGVLVGITLATNRKSLRKEVAQ